MKIVDNIKTFLYDQNYFVSFFNNNVHIFNYLDLRSFTEDEIVLNMDGFLLAVKGKDLKITKMENREIIINGDINNIGIKR